MRTSRDPAVSAAGESAVGLAPLLGLLLLIAGDSAFVLAHLASRGSSELAALYHVGRDGSYAEMFQYAKAYALVVLLGALWARTRERVFGAWMLLFAYVLCDDALLVHERGGRLLALELDYAPALGLRAQDFGELTLWALVGLAFVALIAAAYLRASREARSVSHGMLRLFCALAFFGVVMDLAHVSVQAAGLKDALGLIEDGGEMLVMSLFCWYVAKTLERFIRR